MGKGASKQAQNILADSSKEATQLARELVNEGRPQRQAVGDYLSGIISGDEDLIKPLVAGETSQIRRAGSQAREAINRNAPRGGVRDQALADTYQLEAGQVGQLFTGKINEALARLAALATGTTQSGIASRGQSIQAGGSLAQLGASQAAAWGAGLGGLSGGAGYAIGAGKGGDD